MGSQSASQVVQMLVILLVPTVIAVLILSGVLLYFYFKEKIGKNKKETKGKTQNIQGASQQDKQSIFNFMEFDDVEDNMILQKNEKREEEVKKQHEKE